MTTTVASVGREPEGRLTGGVDRYVRNAWYVAAWSDDLAAGAVLAVRILDEPIVLWRNSEGVLSAFEDRCLHRLAPLSRGRCEGAALRCMYHGLLYDQEGRVVDIPGQAVATDALRLRKYFTTEANDWIWVWMGNPALKASTLPDVSGPSSLDYAFGRGQLDYAAEARLVSDNLLDLSHTSFLHKDSFGVSETWARELPLTSLQDRGVRIERWIRNEGVGGAVSSATQVDTYHRYDFHVPGVMIMSTRCYPAGIADSLGGQTPDLSQPPDLYTSQAVTPITAKTTRYFFVMAQRRSARERFFDMHVTGKAFAEDRVMIEAQQLRMDEVPGRRFLATQADKGVVLYNRLVDRLRTQEITEQEFERCNPAGPANSDE